jgi:hypothetical protein
MQNEMIPGDMRNVWQSQGPASPPPPLEEIRKKADKFRSQIGWRNFREYLVSALMMPYFGYFAWTSRSPTMQAGNGLMIAGLLYMVIQLHRRTTAVPAPVDLGWKTCVAFHRAELERQRDALGSVWKWYLGPMVPGLATISAAGCVTGFRHSTLAGMLAMFGASFVALALWWLGSLNQKAAAQIQKQIDSLDAVVRDA